MNSSKFHRLSLSQVRNLVAGKFAMNKSAKSGGVKKR
jgi:hypothetical protein